MSDQTLLQRLRYQIKLLRWRVDFWLICRESDAVYRQRQQQR
ncbi:hypothetical protein [Cyanobium sp. ULC084]